MNRQKKWMVKKLTIEKLVESKFLQWLIINLWVYS